MKYKGIIFDFNGVLFWDSHLHEKVWRDFSEMLRGFPFSSQEIYGHVHGRTNKCILEYILKKSITSEELNALSSEKESIYQKLCLERSEEFKLSIGAIDLLNFIVEKDIPHTIATASDGNNLEFFIKHLKLERWFDTSKIVYDNGSFLGKKEMYLKASENIGLLPQQCVVIEDAKTGISAACNANIGKIIALGPKDNHDHLMSLEGVSDAIISLDHFKKELIL